MTKILGRNGLKRKALGKLFISAYFIIAAVEIIAEYFDDTVLIYLFKPLIMPALVIAYWNVSKVKNILYIISLLLSMVASIFFVSRNLQSILVGAIFFFFHRVLIIQIVLKHIKLPSVFPMVVGCIPFLFAYMYLIIMTYDRIGSGIVIFVVQCLVISFLGGLSVGNFVLRSSKANTLLLFSTLLHATTQFIFVLKLYYSEITMFQPIAMILFVTAQFLFFRFLLLAEKKRAGFKIRL